MFNDFSSSCATDELPAVAEFEAPLIKSASATVKANKAITNRARRMGVVREEFIGDPLSLGSVTVSQSLQLCAVRGNREALYYSNF